MGDFTRRRVKKKVALHPRETCTRVVRQLLVALQKVVVVVVEEDVVVVEFVSFHSTPLPLLHP